jgi:hypothetical protein
MQTLLMVCLAFLVSAGSLLAADSYVGTWRRNAAKSKPTPAKPGMAVKELTLVVQESGGRYEETETGTRENGSAIATRDSYPLKGGLVTYSDGAPPPGTSEVMKRINDSTREFVTTRDGKVTSTERVTMSANGKAMRVEITGADAEGKPVHSVSVWDKQ